MRVLVIGATGTIGKAVADALAAKHEVVAASRSSTVKIDVGDPKTLEAALDKLGGVDALVNCGGNASRILGPLETLNDEHFEMAFRYVKSVVDVIRVASKHVKDKGSITITTGQLSTHPLPGTSAAAMGGSAIEGFVRAAALEMPRGVRLNAVSPGWVKETMEKLGMDSSPGMPASVLAKFYVQAVEGTMNAKILDPLA